MPSTGTGGSRASAAGRLVISRPRPNGTRQGESSTPDLSSRPAKDGSFAGRRRLEHDLVPGESSSSCRSTREPGGSIDVRIEPDRDEGGRGTQGPRRAMEDVPGKHPQGQRRTPNVTRSSTAAASSDKLETADSEGRAGDQDAEREIAS